MQPFLPEADAVQPSPSMAGAAGNPTSSARVGFKSERCLRKRASAASHDRLFGSQDLIEHAAATALVPQAQREHLRLGEAGWIDASAEAPHAAQAPQVAHFDPISHMTTLYTLRPHGIERKQVAESELT